MSPIAPSGAVISTLTMAQDIGPAFITRVDERPCARRWQKAMFRSRRCAICRRRRSRARPSPGSWPPRRRRSAWRYAFLDGGDELRRDGAALTWSTNSKLGAPRGSARPSGRPRRTGWRRRSVFVAVVALGRRGDGLAVGGARRARIHLAPQTSVYARAGCAGAARRGRRPPSRWSPRHARPSGRDSSSTNLQDLPHALLVAAAWARSSGRNRHREGRAFGAGGRLPRRRAARVEWISPPCAQVARHAAGHPRHAPCPAA